MVLAEALMGLVLTLMVGAAAAENQSDDPEATPDSDPPVIDETAPLDPAPPFFFGEIVVLDENDDESSGTVDTMDAATIRTSGVVTVGEALELMPGVSMSVGGRNEQKIWVRGYEQSNVLFLVDGVPVSDPYYGDLDLGQLPVFDVARVTVSRGAASPLYGPNGLGGVINVTTVQGSPDERLTGELRMTDERTVLAHVGAGGGGERVNWYLGLGVETSDGWPLSDDFEETAFQESGTRVNSDLRRSSAMGRVSWGLGDAGTLHASVRWIDAEKGIPFHTTEPVGFIKFSRFPEWRQTTVALGYEHRLDGGSVRGQLYSHAFDNTLDVYADSDLETLRLSSSFDDRVYGGYVVGDWSVGERHRLSAALHLRQDRHSKTEEYPDGSTDPSENYRAWTWSVSVEDRWRLGERTSLTGSLALEGLDVLEATSLREVDGESVLVEDPASNDVLVSPQLELRRVFGAGWSASAAIYQRARFPTMRQFYGTDPPNPELGPQRTTGLDLGAEWSPDPALAVRGTIFANRVDDLITREGRNHPYRNQDEAEINGLELRIRSVTKVVDISASWTAMDHRFIHSAEGYDAIPFVPDQQIEVVGLVHLGRRFDLRGTWLMTGQRTAYDWGESLTLDGYSLFDLGLVGRAGIAEFSLEIDNVLDADVEAEPGYPLPGRRVWIGCRFAFNL